MLYHVFWYMKELWRILAVTLNAIATLENCLSFKLSCDIASKLSHLELRFSQCWNSVTATHQPVTKNNFLISQLLIFSPTCPLVIYLCRVFASGFAFSITVMEGRSLNGLEIKKSALKSKSAVLVRFTMFSLKFIMVL